MFYSWDNRITRELNKRLLQPAIRSMYYTVCFGNCCPFQLSAMFCVLCPAKKRHAPPGTPMCPWLCPSRVRTWQQGLAAPAGTCWLPPWRCYRGFGTAGEPTSHRVLWWGWLMAKPRLQCNEPNSSLFLEGSGWVPFGLFPMPFILWKRQEVLWSPGLPTSPDVWVWGLSITLGPPSLGHLLPRGLRAALTLWAHTSTASNPSCNWALKIPLGHPTPAGFFLVRGFATLGFIFPSLPCDNPSSHWLIWR